MIVALASDGARPLDLLLLGASLGALGHVGALALDPGDAAQRRLGASCSALAIWIPYVNFVVASIYARRYWSEGARAPALLALAGMARSDARVAARVRCRASLRRSELAPEHREQVPQDPVGETPNGVAVEADRRERAAELRSRSKR